MKIIPSREMAAKPAAIWKALKDEGAVLVTRNGQPEGVFISTSDETWMEDIQSLETEGSLLLSTHASSSG